MSRALIMLVLLCAGCTREATTDYDNAASRYTCTDEQYAKAYKEAKEAIALDVDNHGKQVHYPIYWIGSAIMRNCTLKVAP